MCVEMYVWSKWFILENVDSTDTNVYFKYNSDSTVIKTLHTIIVASHWWTVHKMSYLYLSSAEYILTFYEWPECEVYAIQ